jgi:hypothetical protein
MLSPAFLAHMHLSLMYSNPPQFSYLGVLIHLQLSAMRVEARAGFTQSGRKMETAVQLLDATLFLQVYSLHYTGA